MGAPEAQLPIILVGGCHGSLFRRHPVSVQVSFRTPPRGSARRVSVSVESTRTAGGKCCTRASKPAELDECPVHLMMLLVVDCWSGDGLRDDRAWPPKPWSPWMPDVYTHW